MDISTVVAAFVAALAGAGLVVALVWGPLAGRRSTVPADEPSVRDDALDRHRAEVRHQLDRVADLVMGLAERQAGQHAEVTTSLSQAMKATSGLVDTTADLRRALANPKARGQWGERMADDVLRLAGFTEGISYVRQRTLPNGSIPDVTFLLPGDLVLHMDVKFPLDNYLRALEADAAAERAAAEAAFCRDARQRVVEIAGRGYVEPGVTVDHVLLFVPNEAVFSWMHEHDPELADIALRRKVVLCSPFTLFAVLGVIRQSVEALHVARASDEILECLAAFGGQWQRYADQLDTVAKRFDTAHRGLEELVGTRRRQLERELDRIDRLRTERGMGGPPGSAGGSPRLASVDRAG